MDDRVRIFDTTLRDGEQSPGASLNRAEKMEIARQLEQLGVDVLEAGFPVSSKEDFEAVRQIAAELEATTVTGLARCTPKDVDRAGEAVRDARYPRVHVFCATSKIHLQHKLKRAFEEIMKISVDHIRRARQFVDDVEFSPEDASRTDLDSLVQIVGTAIDAGATTINMPDTVGYATPAEYGELFRHIREKLPIIDEKGITLSAHCHNDLGLAVANSLSAVEHGARQVESTINGIGERAGNAALEEVVMALRTRRDFYGLRTQINCRKIYPVSRMVSNLSGMHVQRNKAVVGANAFSHEAGIHQDGVLKHRQTYEIMDPTELGVPSSELVLGKHSGRNAFRERLQALGYVVDEQTLGRIFEAFKELAEKKKEVYDEDIEALVESHLDTTAETPSWQLEELQVTSGSSAIPTGAVTLSDATGRRVTDAAYGDGPIDAIYSAVQRIVGISVELVDYQIRAVTQGKDAQGEVTVEVKHQGHHLRGRGVSTDVIEASGKAYLAAINRVRMLNRVAATEERAAQP